MTVTLCAKRMNWARFLLVAALGVFGLGISNARAQSEEPIRNDVICPPAEIEWGYRSSGASNKTDSGNSTPLQIISKPIGRYTQKARDLCIQGNVLLKVKFRSDGTIGKISVVQGLPHGLSEKAIEAANRMKFTPATKRGKAKTVTRFVEYHFNIY